MNHDYDPTRPGTVELVPRRDGTWTPAPRHRPLAHKARAWLRTCVEPAPPETYLAEDEPILLRTRRHWLVPLRDLAKAAVSMPAGIVCSLLLAFLAPGWWWLQAGMWIATVVHQAYLGYLVVAWRADQIVVTDRRLIRISGVFTTTIDDRALIHITDRTVHQSLIGRVLHYGTLRVESAGRHDNGATRERIEYLPNPGEVYRALLL